MITVLWVVLGGIGMLALAILSILFALWWTQNE
jgi:hypothetical protein